MSAEGGSASATKVDGVGNTISNTVLTMSNNRGLDVSGENNTVTNVLVDHTDWLGTLTCVAKSNTCMIVLLSHTHTHIIEMGQLRGGLLFYCLLSTVVIMCYLLTVYNR